MSNVQFAHAIPIIPGYEAVVPMVLAQSNPGFSLTSSTSATDVTGTLMNLPRGFMAPGSTVRYTLSGTRTGANDACTFTVVLNATTALSIAIPSNTTKDFVAEFTIHQYSGGQVSFGTVMINATTYMGMDNNTSTVSVASDDTIKVQATLTNGSDALAINFVSIEYWQTSFRNI